MRRRAAAALVAVLVAGCGGAATKPLSSDDARAVRQSAVTAARFCAAQLAARFGRPGGDPAALDGAVSQLIEMLRTHGDVTNGGQSLAGVLREVAAVLRSNDCAPGQADRLDQATAGKR